MCMLLDALNLCIYSASLQAVYQLCHSIDGTSFQASGMLTLYQSRIVSLCPYLYALNCARPFRCPQCLCGQFIIVCI